MKYLKSIKNYHHKRLEWIHEIKGRVHFTERELPRGKFKIQIQNFRARAWDDDPFFSPFSSSIFQIILVKNAGLAVQWESLIHSFFS